MWIIEYYQASNGKCPTQEFLDDLKKRKELPHAIRLINLLAEHGNNLKRPYVEHLGGGIYELRIRVKRQQIRILYFYFYQERIIFSHGIRKEDDVPPSEIDKAQKNKSDYFLKHERKP